MSEEIKNGNLHNIDSLLQSTYEEKAPSFLDTSNDSESTDALRSEEQKPSSQDSQAENNEESSSEDDNIDDDWKCAIYSIIFAHNYINLKESF